MSRKIKFRAWADNKMDYSPETFTGWLNDNFIFDGYDEGKEPVVMQFTGLLDKQGKEIFEGDIVEITHHNVGPTKVRRIITWKELGIYTGWNITRRTTVKTHIIGNIYENPELIK